MGRISVTSYFFAGALAPNVVLRRMVSLHLLQLVWRIDLKLGLYCHWRAAVEGRAQSSSGSLCILAEGAIALSVTLSGGALFAS